MTLESTLLSPLDFPLDTNVLLHFVETATLSTSFAARLIEEHPSVLDKHNEAITLGYTQFGMFSGAETAAGKKIVSLYVGDSTRPEGSRKIDYEAVYATLASVHELLIAAYAEGRAHHVVIATESVTQLGGSLPIVEAIAADIWNASPLRCVLARKLNLQPLSLT